MRTLKEVRYVPDLKRNLLSIGMLDKSGCIIKVDGGIMKIMNGILIVMKGTLNNGLYVLQGKTVVGMVGNAKSDCEKTKLWHLRLGHVSERGLNELGK